MKKNDLRKICKDLVIIITESKATFFQNEGNKDIKISEEDLLYELKSEIMTNCEMYFYNKINEE